MSQTRNQVTSILSIIEEFQSKAKKKNPDVQKILTEVMPEDFVAQKASEESNSLQQGKESHG